MENRALGKAVLQERCELGDGDGRRQRRSQDRHAGCVGLGGTSGCTARPSVTSTHGIWWRKTRRALAPGVGRQALEIADLAGAEHDHAAGLQVSIEPRQARPVLRT